MKTAAAYGSISAKAVQQQQLVTAVEDPATYTATKQLSGTTCPCVLQKIAVPEQHSSHSSRSREWQDSTALLLLPGAPGSA
jgi:hypothetical protein